MKETKPVLFVGSSFEARDFAEALQLNLKEVARVIPWTQVNFELSSFTLETLETELERADFAAFIFAPDDHLRIRGNEVLTTRDNVLLELGMFIGQLGRHRSFIVIATGTEKMMRIPTDLLGLTVATYDHTSYDEKEGPATETMGTASTKIKAAIRRHGLRQRLPTIPIRRVARVLSRGSTDSIMSVADGAIYVADSRHEYPLQLRRRLLLGEVVPMKYLYCTPYGSSHWLEICKRRSYTFYRNSLNLLRAKAPEVMAKIVETLGTAEIDFISLGSGDGIKDNILLRELGSKLRGSDFAYYYPVDISPDLIVHAVPTALRGLVRSQFRVKALIADFTQLSALQVVYEERQERNVFSILGNTIGNADEDDLMRSVADGMLPGDMLLLEINTSEPKEDDPILREKANMEHDFTPLKSLNIDFDPNRMEYHLLSEHSVVPATKSVLASYSKAVIDNQPVSNVKLSIVHHYNLDQLVQSIEDRMSVKTVARFETDGVGIILAQR
jgi:uncharacterized SAM-dependent methyltransferase